MPSPIEETITELTDNDKSLPNSRLVDLSNLSPEEVELFEQAWAIIEPKRRRHIIYRLVELAEEDVKLDFESIFRDRLSDEDAEVRSKAIEGLWESEDTSLINPLIILVEQDSSEKVQAAAATALGKFVMLAELEKLRSCYKSKIEHVLLSVSNDKSVPVEVRRRALEAVAPLSLPEVKEAIMEAYQSPDPKLRVSAIYAMGRNCDPSCLPILIRELASTDAETRYEASEACGELGEKEAVPYLIELIDDLDVEVQLAAIRALGEIGGSEAEECLEECQKNPSEEIRLAAEQALNEMEVEEDPFSFKHGTGLA